MKEWQRKDIRKSVVNFRKTDDIQNLMDIPRILTVSKIGKIKSLVGARLKEITFVNLFRTNYIKQKGFKQ